jgi:hypothetical protein
MGECAVTSILANNSLVAPEREVGAMKTGPLAAPLRGACRPSLAGAALALLWGVLFALASTSSPAGTSPAALQEFSFHHDNVLGTSLDLLLLAADAETAEAGEQAVLHEVERLRRIPIRPARLAVVELLRSQFGAVGAVDTFEIEEDSLRIVFRGPGRQGEAHVKRDTGEAEVVSESHGVVGRLTDLHKGKYAGAAWGAIIDGVSGLLLVVSLALWLSLQRRRWLGMIVLALRFALSVGIYLAFVP